MKVHMGKNGAYVAFEKTGNLYVVTLRDTVGNVAGKRRCDTYAQACAYRAAFLKITKKG